MNIEVYIRADDALMQSLDRIEGLLLRITRQLRTVQQNQEIAMADLTDLQTEVTQNTDVVASAVSLLNGLSLAEPKVTLPPAVQPLSKVCL